MSEEKGLEEKVPQIDADEWAIGLEVLKVLWKSGVRTLRYANGDEYHLNEKFFQDYAHPPVFMGEQARLFEKHMRNLEAGAIKRE